MRFRSALVTATLGGALALAGCGSEPPPDATSGDARSAAEESTTSSSDQQGPAPGGAEIPDDFPLSIGMGGPDDTIATSRTGTGLRDLAVCDTAPLRGLATRDRMIADNSGGEAANTRELVLLGSNDEAALVARSFIDLSSSCTAPSRTGDMETLTEVRRSPFGPSPAVTLVQTYTFDGERGPGATVVHVVPVGAALLVTSTYGQWTGDTLEQGVVETVDSARQAVSALEIFDDAAPSSEASPEPSDSPQSLTGVDSAHTLLTTYGDGLLASLDEQADGVTMTTETLLPAMCVFTRTGC
jgi:hypothetical protein